MNEVTLALFYRELAQVPICLSPLGIVEHDHQWPQKANQIETLSPAVQGGTEELLAGYTVHPNKLPQEIYRVFSPHGRQPLR